MPDEYNWILQKLLSIKEIGIVISDKTLCLGIDLPVRTSCFLGINQKVFTKEEYLQMSGRAGRRGMDTKGNIIFYGSIDYCPLMKGEMPEIIGNNNPIYKENFKIFKDYNPVFENMVHKDREIISVNNPIVVDEKDKKLIWNIRMFKNSFSFLKQLKSIEKKLWNLNENDRPIQILNDLSELIGYSINEPYKLKKINNHQDIKKIQLYSQVILMIHNSLNYQKYSILMKTYQEVFTSLNRMLFSTMI